MWVEKTEIRHISPTLQNDTRVMLEFILEIQSTSGDGVVDKEPRALAVRVKDFFLIFWVWMNQPWQRERNV